MRMKRICFLFILILSENAWAQFTKLLDFNSMQYGNQPQSSLFFDGTYLYGMTAYGGLYSNGAIYKVKPDGSNYTRLYNFGLTPDAYHPHGSLMYDGTYLYGAS